MTHFPDTPSTSEETTILGEGKREIPADHPYGRDYLIHVLRRLAKADLILGDEGEDLDLRNEVRSILMMDDLDHGRTPLCQDIDDAVFKDI